MDTPRESGSSFRTAFAMFAGIVAVASAGGLMMGASKAASPEKANAAPTEVKRGLTLKEWLLIAK